MFYPPKQAIHTLIGRWDDAVLQKGLDPFVGRKVFHCLREAGFFNIETKPYSKISTGIDQVQYQATARNLQGIYMGTGPEFVGLSDGTPLWRQAKEEFECSAVDDLILETYFVNIGTKE